MAAARMRVLAVNAGSSSLKLSVLGDGDEPIALRELQAPRSELDEGELRRALAELGTVDAVGHRVVHGGRRFVGPVLVSPQVVAELAELAELAPLHQAKSLEALQAVGRALPEAPAVACFDTAFHARLPEAAATYALPQEWRKRFAIRRYGFHGLSHAYATRRAAALLGRSPEELRIVTCHLGAGASLAAVQGGHSVDTTMGFTPLEGLVMATRSGSVDPGLLLWLLQHTGISEQQMAHALEHDSGLVALAGTSEMQTILRDASAGDDRAQASLDVYLHRLRSAIAAMAAAMGGLDVLVFTAGVGEHAAAIRAGAVQHLGFLGIELDHEGNESVSDDADISGPTASVRTVVIRAREDLEIGRQVREVLARD